MTRVEALSALQRKAQAMTPEQRNELARRMMDEAAPGDAFERLARAGWKPKSAMLGDGLPPCGESCGICNPDEETRARVRREHLRRKR